MSEKKSEEEKIRNGKEILRHIKDIKSSYEAQQVDEEEESMSFLDKLNGLVRLILDDKSLSIYDALDEDRLEKWNRSKVTRWLKKTVLGNFRNFLYFLLLGTITAFLVSEAVNFYAIDGVISTKTYIKAILTEVCFIFLSGYKANGKLQAAWVFALRSGVFALMMFVITSQTLSTGTKTISENTAIQEQIVLIQEQVAQKEKDISYFKEIGWPRNVARSTVEKEELVKKLVNLKEQQASGKNESVSEIEKYKMYGRAAFRILLLFITVLITRRLFTF